MINKINCIRSLNLGDLATLISDRKPKTKKAIQTIKVSKSALNKIINIGGMK